MRPGNLRPTRSGQPRTLLAATLAILLNSAFCASVGLAEAKAPKEPSPQGVIVFLVDTLRADRLSIYGHTRDTTPTLRVLAKEGVVFERAISNSAWTLPATVGLLTGRYPTRRIFDRHLNGSLVEHLPVVGIATAAFTEGGFFTRAYGMDAGFDTYVEEESAVRLFVTGAGHYHKVATGNLERTFAQSSDWLSRHRNERFFLVVHTYEAHSPYRDRRYVGKRHNDVIGKTFENTLLAAIRNGTAVMGNEELDYLGDLYDGGVSAVDTRIARLLAHLEVLGLADKTVVVVTSDHGEDLGRRVAKRAGHHGHTLYGEQIRVPLLIRDPTRAFAEARIATQVRLIDVLPTVFDLLDVTLPADLDGRSLVPLMMGDRERDRVALSWTQAPPMGLNSTRFAYSDGRYKLIENDPKGSPELPRYTLFDLRDDPAELQNLYTREPEISARLLRELRREREAIEAVGHADYQDSPDLVDSVRRRLRSLGYVRP